MSHTPDTVTRLLAVRTQLASPALIERDRAIPYTAIEEEAKRLAAGFASLGLGRGDRIAIWLPNVPAWLACFFACAQLVAIAVSVNTRFRSHEVADIVRRSGARLLIFWPGFKGIDFTGILAACDPAVLQHLETVVAYSDGGASPPSDFACKPCIDYAEITSRAPLEPDYSHPDDGCVIFSTSGTTKAPKFVLHDQRTLVNHGADVAESFGIGAQSAVLLAPPLCGIYGFCSFMAALSAGCPLVMMPAWDPAEAARMIDAYRVTHANATDEAVAQLLAHSTEQFPFRSVSFIGYAAFSPALGDIVARADARGVRLVGLYGTSEVQALFSRQGEFDTLEERALGGGRPVNPATRVRARDPASGQVLPDGESGELEFDAPSRMQRYFGDPEATRSAFSADGFYRSGDLGYTTGDGRFVFLARMNDSLRLGGFLVSPLEIEGVVQELAGVAACQVVGVPRADGLKAVAFVILSPGATLDEAKVISHVAGKLAKYKVPVRVFAIEAFPVTPGANATKIQKHKLRDLAVQLMG
ncbi:MAG: AMP-binding protein [Betaproteobacteria bacterium]|nr:AMP-binding protein [Betaproteobacteria bacterium]